MEQSALDIAARAKLVAEKLNRSLMDGASYPVIDGCAREFVNSRLPDQDRGLVGKLADAFLYLISGRRFTDSIADRQRD